MALKLVIQTYHDDEVCIPSLSSILLAVPIDGFLSRDIVRQG